MDVSKNEFKVILSIVFLSVIFVIYLLFRNVTNIVKLNSTHERGISIEAKIINLDLTRYINITYNYNRQVFNKKLSVSDQVFKYHKDKTTIMLKILPDDPSFVTWNGDRRLYTNILSVSLLVMVLSVMIFALIGGILWLKRN